LELDEKRDNISTGAFEQLIKAAFADKTIFGENTPLNNVEAYTDLVGDNQGALTELCNLDKG